jgi:hypothetical protein
VTVGNVSGPPDAAPPGVSTRRRRGNIGNHLQKRKQLMDINTLLEMFSHAQDHPYKVGENYLVRTRTNYYTGRLLLVMTRELVLEDAAWIADTGRLYDALKTGNLEEVEPIIGDLIISRGAIVDVIEWGHKLPREQR